MSTAAFGELVAAVPAPLAIGTVILDTGDAVKGFLCESAAVEGASDITAYGGWRKYYNHIAR
jgi:allophanate hydrolase